MSLFQPKFAALEDDGGVPDGTICDITNMLTSDAAKHLFGLIDWQEYIRAGSFLSQSEFQLLERAQENLEFALGNDGQFKNYANILMKLADKCIANVNAQQYVFTKILEILDVPTNIKERATKFTIDGTRVFDAPFLRALRSSDNYVQRTSSEALALLLTVCEGDINSLISWLCENLGSVVIGVPETAIPALTIIMRRGSYRKPFANKGGITLVVTLLGKLGNNGPAQQLYELCFILWSLSLDDDADIHAYKSSGAVRILTDLLSAAPSRKVVRMAIATLINIAKSEDDGVLTEMLAGGLVRLLENMIHANAHKQAGDPEVETDVSGLYTLLMKNYREFSSFDRWVLEVTNGNLRFGICHGEKFWRENARLLEKEDFKYLKMLIALLHSGNEAIVPVALYDLGEFTRFYPNGRGVVKSLGGKDVAMDMISSSNPEVQRHALQCISKIMVTNWEFMK